MLRNRQSSVTPVNLKRPAPSGKSVNAKGPSVPPGMHLPPQRSNTAPHQLMARSHKAEAKPNGLDDNKSSRSHSRTRSDIPSNTTTPSFMPSTPEPAMDTTATSPENYSNSNVSFSTTPSPLQSAMPRPDAQSAMFPPQFTNFSNVPDLMPIMFPSDDPFAYPTQPMSTLEDGHFRQDGSGVTNPFTFDQRAAMSSAATTTGPNGMNLSSPTLDNLANLSLFPNNGTPTGMSPVMPNRFANHPQTSQSRLHSPVSTPSGEVVNSPDLVSIPNQNFAWQGYNFQPQNWSGNLSTQPQQPRPQAQQQQQPMAAANDLGNFRAGFDESASAGMGIDLGIPVEDILGSSEACRPAGSYNNDDWIQWMNVGN